MQNDIQSIECFVEATEDYPSVKNEIKLLIRHIFDVISSRYSPLVDNFGKRFPKERVPIDDNNCQLVSDECLN